VLRRSEERLLAAADGGDEPGYAGALRTARTGTLLTIVLIVLTIYVMTAKPFA
jgi:hypothetical protein